MAFPENLIGHVWHTTSIAGFRNILEDGHILAEPDISNDKRFMSSDIEGKPTLPYVRILGGISLFDFRVTKVCNFEDENADALRFIWNFVPCYKDSKKCRTGDKLIWIEIDHTKLEKNYIDALTLTKAWKSNKKNWKHSYMPYFEATSLISIPISFFKKVLIWDASKNTYLDHTF